MIRVGFAVVLCSTAVVTQAQTNSGMDQDSYVFDAGANRGTLHVTLTTYSIPDQISIYYPPRGTQGGNSSRLFNWQGVSPFTGTNIVVNFGPGSGNNVEIVMNEGGGALGGSLWDYNGTVYPQGGSPRTFTRDPTMINPIRPPGRPSTITTTGTIFAPPTKASGGGETHHRRRGHVGRIITPVSGVRLPKSNTNGGGQLNPQGQLPKVLFTGKRNTSMTTYLRKIPTRSVRRVILRGGRAR